MSKRKVASGISKVINKLHGIDKQEPLVEGVDYTVPKEGEGVQLSQEFIDSMRQRSLELLAQSEGMKEVTSTPIMSAVLKPNPKRAQAQQQSQQAPEEEKKDDAPKKDPNFTKIGPGVVQPLKVNDSEADILGKMFNFMKMEYDWESKQHKKDKKYHKALDEQKERFLEETIEAITGSKPKGTKKSGGSKKKSGLLKTALKGAAGIGAFFLAEKALANVDWKSIVPSFEKTKVDNLPELDLGQSKDIIAARKSAEEYLGKKMSDKEWDMLLRTTAAESSQNTTSQAMVMGTILNRAKSRFAGQEEPVIGAITQKNQFQAATGTSVNAYQPSEKFKKGPSEKEIESMAYGAINILPGVSSKQEYFTATDPKAYGPGTNIEFLNKMRREGGVEIAGSIFNTPAPIPRTATVPEIKDTTIPQKIKPSKSDKDSTVGVISNNTNIINGGTTYSVSQEYVSHYPSLIQQQYQLS